MKRDKTALRKSSPYTAVLTREQFLFYEVRTTAKLLCEGLEDAEAIDRIVNENLFQYPTEKMVRRMARTCIQRLRCLDDDNLIQAIAFQPSDVSKQICLYTVLVIIDAPELSERKEKYKALPQKNKTQLMNRICSLERRLEPLREYLL